MDETGGTPPREGRRPTRADEVAQVFGEDYRAYQYCFVEFLIEHLSDVSRTFRGDLQAALVLALVGQAWLGAARSAAAAGAGPETLPPARTSTSASRIADITGIPRQTVRRKLARLEDRGWIRRNADGSVRLVAEGGETAARRDLSEIDRRALLRVARLFADLEGLVAARAPGPEDARTGGRERASCRSPAQNEHPSPPGA